MTFTDLLQLAVKNAIEEQRESLDAMKGAHQVTVIANLDSKRGLPRRVSIRTESTTGVDDAPQNGNVTVREAVTGTNDISKAVVGMIRNELAPSTERTSQSRGRVVPPLHGLNGDNQ